MAFDSSIPNREILPARDLENLQTSTHLFFMGSWKASLVSLKCRAMEDSNFSNLYSGLFSPGRFYAAFIMKMICAHILIGYDIELANPTAPRTFSWRSGIVPYAHFALRIWERLVPEAPVWGSFSFFISFFVRFHIYILYATLSDLDFSTLHDFAWPYALFCYISAYGWSCGTQVTSKQVLGSGSKLWGLGFIEW